VHTFDPIPCLESNSGTEAIVDPTYTDDCPLNEPSRSWRACTASGCHGSEAVAASLLNQISNERNGYINTIWQDLNGNRSLDASPVDGGYLATIKAQRPGEVRYCNLTGTSNLCLTAQDSTDSQRLTPAKGALFNAQLFGESLSGHPDGSHGVHNPYLYRAALLSTIADLEANYGAILAAPPAPVLSRIREAIQSGTLRVSPKLEQAIMRVN
jgi:hypothetical protein